MLVQALLIVSLRDIGGQLVHYVRQLARRFFLLSTPQAFYSLSPRFAEHGHSQAVSVSVSVYQGTRIRLPCRKNAGFFALLVSSELFQASCSISQN